jgi:REP element-mobilizing transposase RayT
MTICAQNKEYIFGNIIDGKMVLNSAGEMIKKWLFELKNKFKNIELDEYVIMPNHIHLIIFIINIARRQRNYYERVIRNEKELDKIRKYIFENPLKWELDRNNPENLFM